MEFDNQFFIGAGLGVIIIYALFKWFTRAPYAMESDFEELLKGESGKMSKFAQMNKAEREAENKRLLRRYVKTYWRLVENDTNEEIELEELEAEILKRMNEGEAK